MDSTRPSKLGRLNSYQIAGLAVLTSTIAAVTVLLAIRLILNREEYPEESPGEPTDVPAVQPAVDPAMSSRLPHHFSENLIVPGLTETGEEVLRDDAEEGHSPEGV